MPKKYGAGWTAVASRRETVAGCGELPAHGPNPGLAAAGSSAAPGLITYHATYYDYDLDQYASMPGARFQVYHCSLPFGGLECDPQDWTLQTSGWANSSGDFAFDCSGDEYEVYVSTWAGSGRFQVGNVTDSRSGQVQSDCGSMFDITLPSAHAKVFLNMNKTLDGFVSLFGQHRSFIQVVIDTDATHSSHYNTSTDEITIVSPKDVWEGYINRGSFVASHEYGHAFDQDVLGAVLDTISCPAPHYTDVDSGVGCAWSEGFADYTGGATRPDLSSYAYRDQAGP